MNLNSSSVPSPPPVPPSPFLQSPIKTRIYDPSKIGEEELNLAIRRLLLFEKFFQVFYSTNSFLTPQIQDGPQCGLVALSIASSINEKLVEVDEIFKLAQSEGFTKQGEIFDAYYLAFLAEKCCGFKANVIEEGLNLHINCIIDCLLNKGLVLVPYDADFNHSPCCKQGFKSHWTVISGFVIFEHFDQHLSHCENTVSEEKKQNFIVIKSLDYNFCECEKARNNFKETANVGLFKHQNSIVFGKSQRENFVSLNNCKEGKIYLIGMQGKSKHLGLWSFDSMVESNNNLLYFSTARDFENYIVPEGGPAKGLKGKAILLSLYDS